MEAYRVASGFFFFNLLFTVLFIAVSLAISWLAFRAYRLTKQQKTGIFSLAFLLIAVSYFASIIPFLAHISFDDVPVMPSFIFPVSMFVFAFLYISGAILLLSTTFKKWRVQTAAILIALGTAWILIAPRFFLVPHVINILIFGLIAGYYLRRHIKRKERSTLTVFCGFLFLMIANCVLTFANHHSLFFTAGRLLELAGYSAFIIDLWLVLRR